MEAIRYHIPHDWIRYDAHSIFPDLVNAKASILSLKAIPHQRDWVEKLQEIQLKMEVAGTSRIEGADFTDNELEAAINPGARAAELITRSQRQARSAVETYRWIATLPNDRPVDEDFIREVHRRMVTGCDDDRCPPGELRSKDVNVTFGYPRHRGCEGGDSCKLAFSQLARAINHEYRSEDPLIQAIALHYHFAAMHPFLDGNGRTARALEAFVLQRAGLRDTAFIAMSNYYYEEKAAYLDVLSKVRAGSHDLTPFLSFGLRGVAIQCDRLFREIKKQLQKAVFRNMMYELFRRLESPRKRVIAERQIDILKLLLDRDSVELPEVMNRTETSYKSLTNPTNALIRDLNAVITLGAINPTRSSNGRWKFEINLDWPEQMTETDFINKIKQLPKDKMYSFL